MNSTLVTRTRRAPISVAVTGSKGGVGKSNFAVNLAVSLARLERRVLLVDGDLGLANLDVLLGLVPRRTVEHLLRGEATLEELLLNGPAGVRILPAACGVPALARLTAPARDCLFKALTQAGNLTDALIVDTGAGLGDVVLALQLAAARVIVLTTPEPTSMVDAYATCKVLWDAEPTKPIDLVVNAAEDDDEALRVFEQISRAAKHFLGHPLGWLGPVFRDPQVGAAVRRQQPLVELYPTSPAARCYDRVALSLVAQPAGAVATDYWQSLLESAPLGVLQ